MASPRHPDDNPNQHDDDNHDIDQQRESNGKEEVKEDAETRRQHPDGGRRHR